MWFPPRLNSWGSGETKKHKQGSPLMLQICTLTVPQFEFGNYSSLVGHKVPVIHLSLFPGSAITNMCLHAWNLYVGSGDWTRVLTLVKQALMTELALQPQDYFWLLSLKNINMLVKIDWLLQKLSIHLLFQSIKVFFILSFLLSSFSLPPSPPLSFSLLLFFLLYYNTVNGVFMVSSFLEVILEFEPFYSVTRLSSKSSFNWRWGCEKGQRLSLDVLLVRLRRRTHYFPIFF